MELLFAKFLDHAKLCVMGQLWTYLPSWANHYRNYNIYLLFSDAIKLYRLQISDLANGNKSEEIFFFLAPCSGYSCGNEGPETAVSIAWPATSLNLLVPYTGLSRHCF